MKKEFSIWISGAALIISVVAVCVSVWRSPDLTFDYQGVIVGVLSLLVTVLIGFQIYNYISINKKVSTIEETAFRITNLEIEKYGHSVKAFVLTLNSIGLYMRNISECAVDNYIMAIEEGFKGLDPDGVLLPLGYLENIIKENNGYIELLPGKKHYYLSVLSRIEDKERKGKLMDFIMTAPEKKV